MEDANETGRREPSAREDAGPEEPGREAPNPEEPGLEARLRRLDEIVSALEADELELERALALFEEGVGHVRRAEAILAEAELRVEELLGDGSEGLTRPFDDGRG